MSKPQSTLKRAALVFFGVLSWGVLLIIGGFAAQILWHATHHRYDQPITGYYNGMVIAHFSYEPPIGSHDRAFFTAYFKGQTEPEWRWSKPVFRYRLLELKTINWNTENAREREVTLRLPSFEYTSEKEKGVLTQEIIAQWLVGDPALSTPTNSAAIAQLFGFFEAAGNGTLPRPRHHSHNFEAPLRGRIQHFQLGWGVGWTVYAWVAIWLCLFVITRAGLWRFQKPSRRIQSADIDDRRSPD